MFNTIKNFSLSHPLATLCTAGMLVFGIHLATVADYPAGWFDEIEIIEMGRFSIFCPFPDWSVNLLPGADGILHPPAPMFHYLYGFVQESLYRLTGSFLPGRVFALFSLPVVALLLFVWLRAKELPASAALPAALFLLLDPNATICAHWYRPDLWTTSLALASMVLLSATGGNATWRRPAACLLAGVLTATMLFTWITSMMLLPLIGWEALRSVRPLSARRVVRDAAIFSLGAICAASLPLVPLIPHVPAILDQYARQSELGNTAFGVSAGRLADFVKIAIRSPCVWFLALLGVASGRKFPVHAAIFAGLCALMISTRVYHLRMVQLMPFLFLFAAVAIDRVRRTDSRLLRRARGIFVGLGLLCYLGLSVVALNYAAVPGANTFAAIKEGLRAAVPEPSPKVYLYDMEHELYYPGRALGWKMYSHTPRNLVFSPESSAGLLDRIDAVVVSRAAKPQPTEAELGMLVAHGFGKTGEIRFPAAPVSAVKSALEALFYAHGYPDCDIYTRIRQ